MAGHLSYPSADVILAVLGIRHPKDIQLEAIAYLSGATIVARRTEGCEARLVGAGDQAIITVNAASPPERRRFSAAHELGHWFFNHGTIALSCTEENFNVEWGEETIERRANRFAAELLLPASMVRPMVQDCDVSFALVDQLMAEFGTSLPATAIRLIELASFPAMLICSEQGRRRWFVRSPILPNDFWPYTEPRAGTATVDVLNQRLARGDVRRLTGDHWIGHRAARQERIHEEVRRLSNDFVLSLLTW